MALAFKELMVERKQACNKQMQEGIIGVMTEGFRRYDKKKEGGQFCLEETKTFDERGSVL